MENKKLIVYGSIISFIFAIGLFVYTVNVSHMISYFSSDPKACINCHTMQTQYATWQHSSHRERATCIECHLPTDGFVNKWTAKAKDGFNHSYAMTFNTYKHNIQISEDGAKRVQANCISCHSKTVSTMKTNSDKYHSFKDGESLQNGRKCWDCHKEVPHGKVRSLTTTPYNIGVKEKMKQVRIMKKFKLLLAGSLLAIGSMSMLVASINEKEAEKAQINSNPKIGKFESKNEEFRKYYPRQFDSWKKTKESEELPDMLEEYPELVVLWAGYGFSKDYNAPRGHFYAVEDNRNTLRTGAPVDGKKSPMKTACWTCKSPDVPRLIDMVGEQEYYKGSWDKWGKEVANPIGCVDCHNTETMELQVKGRNYLARALEAEGSLKMEDATHQDMRSLVCAQCHVEYYFKPSATDKDSKWVTLPWDNGLAAEDMEKYFDERGFKDWTHKVSKTPMLKTQHPGYELWKTGIHGQRGVSCADCHMPYTQEGGVKYTDHQIGNPLDNMEKTCMNCHRESEKSLLDNVKRKKERKNELAKIAMQNLAKAHLEARKAWDLGATEAEMKDILLDIRHGQWRWDFSVASHAAFFHAPEEVLRLLGSAIDKAKDARIKLAKVLAKYGAADYKTPDFSTKEKAQKVIGLPFEKMVKAKNKFREQVLPEWKKAQEAKGIYNPSSMEGIKDLTSYNK